ncbi:DUF397 domain-containing protein [Nonomuraea sp. CA-143628]|uniref:DUF397 domain-containing protein n=1 Tax=Nonomuraea sp. CA-143628 TaxID=3239997 RepID=UPI003D8CD1E1
MMENDLLTAAWQRSSRCSSNNGACVEIARLRGGRVAIRDSKNPHVHPLIISDSAYEEFINSIK